MNRSINGAKHLSSSHNNQYCLVSDDAHNSADLHIHKGIDNIVSYASRKKFSSEHKPVMIWTKLVQPFISANCQLRYQDCTVALNEACEHCGLSKKLLKCILSALFAKNVPLSSKVYTRHICKFKLSERVAFIWTLQYHYQIKITHCSTFNFRLVNVLEMPLTSPLLYR
jgi:hypothetical protein